MDNGKILIIGQKGFIGSFLAQWLKERNYEVISLSGRNEEWKSYDMTGVHTVVYAAGLAHTKEKKGGWDLFYKINTLQAEESAKRARLFGVPHYIYISSMNIYGNTGKRVGETTPVRPDSFYGKSKRLGEIRILKLENEIFKTAIIRPPVVCGYGCKGNISFLLKVSKYIKLFPDYSNQKSVVDIINLCNLINLIIENKDHGIYHPQDKDYLSTFQLLSIMAHERGKKIYSIRFLNPLIARLIPKSKIIQKIFGDDCYDKSMSDHYDYTYCTRDYSNSVRDMIYGTQK